MFDYSTEDLILAYLAENGGSNSNTGKSESDLYPVSTPGITEELGGSGEFMSERIRLLSSISNLQKSGMVEEGTAEVGEGNATRNVYYLTEKGKERADEFVNEAKNQSVEVRLPSGEKDRVSLGEMDDYTSGLDIPGSLGFIDSLMKLNDGVLYLDTDDSHVQSGFVDREDEIKQIKKIIKGGDEPRVVAIKGEEGVGKTMMATKIQDLVEDKFGGFVMGRSQSETARPYHPFKQVFEDSELNEGFENEKLEAEDEESFEAQRNAMFSSIAEKFDSAAPLVVFIDDIDYADSATLELLDYLLNNLSEDVVFVVTHKPGFETGISNTESTVFLEPFGVVETKKLIESIVGRRGVPDAFVELVHEKTGGNPLFVEESVKKMIEEGKVSPKHSVYPDDSDEIPIPDEVRKTVRERLESLDPTALRILHTGAVIGEEINFDLLAEVEEIDEPELRDYTDLLVDTGVWMHQNPQSFRFVTGAVRETILDTSLSDFIKRERMAEENTRDNEGKRRGQGLRSEEETHIKVAESMIQIFTEELEEKYGEVAYHFEQGGERERAIEYYVKAAEYAESIYAHEVAHEEYDNALDLARDEDDDRKVLKIIRGMGKVDYLAGNYEDAEKKFEYVLDRSNDIEDVQRSTRYLADMKLRLGEYDEAKEYVEMGLDVDESPSSEYSRLLGKKGWALMRKGELEESRNYFVEQREIAEKIGDYGLVGQALHDLGTVELTQGNIQEAIETMEVAVEFREDSEDRRGLANSLNNLAVMHLKIDEFEEAENLHQRALSIRSEIGDRVGLSRSYTNLGVVADKCGEWQDSIEYYEKALDESRRLGNRQNVANVLGNIGQIHLKLGELEEATQHLEKSLELERELGNKRHLAHFLISMAEVEMLKNQLKEAESTAKEAFEHASESGARETESNALSTLGEIDRMKGNLEDAIEKHQDGIEIAEEVGSLEKEAYNRRNLAEDYLESGETETAKHEASNSVEVSSGDPYLLTRSMRVLGKCDRYLGNYGGAEETIEDALDTASDLGARIEELCALHELGLLYFDDPEKPNDEAKEMVETSLGMAREIGADLLVSRFESSH